MLKLGLSMPSYRILHGSNTDYHWSGPQPFSIKTFRHGRALYSIDGATYAVDDTAYLLVNDDQPYTIAIAAPQPVESFCVFFAPALVADVWRAWQAPSPRLLDEPIAMHFPINFYERTYRHDALVSPHLFRLRAGLTDATPDPLWRDEQVHALLQALFSAHQRACQEVEALAALRPATRDELYRRVYRAREYAVAFSDTAVTLDDLAHVACLSPNHLLRVFRQVFHQTPHQFLTDCRLNRASQLLIETDEPVTAICGLIGFSSLGSFGTLFRRRHGIAPQAYRAQHRPQVRFSN